MSKNNQKKSIKQVIKGEYKLVLVLTALFALLPTIAAIISISDLISFNATSIMQKVAVLLGLGDSPFHDVSLLLLIHGVILIVLLPVIASVIARKLNGQRLLHSIRDGFKDVKQKRFWNYVVKVYIPAYVVMIIAGFILKLTISSTQMATAFAQIVLSTPLTIVVAIMVIIISSLVASIYGMIIIANIVYMRSDMRIKHSFQAIQTRDVNKYIIFNIGTIVLLTIIFVIFFNVLTSLDLVDLIQSIINYIIAIEVIMLICQIVFTYLRVVLFVNIASKAEKKNISSKNKKAISQNLAIESSK